MRVHVTYTSTRRKGAEGKALVNVSLFPVDELGQEAEPENDCVICGAPCHDRYCTDHDPTTAAIPF